MRPPDEVGLRRVHSRQRLAAPDTDAPALGTAPIGAKFQYVNGCPRRGVLRPRHDQIREQPPGLLFTQFHSDSAAL